MSAAVLEWYSASERSPRRSRLCGNSVWALALSSVQYYYGVSTQTLQASFNNWPLSSSSSSNPAGRAFSLAPPSPSLPPCRCSPFSTLSLETRTLCKNGEHEREWRRLCEWSSRTAGEGDLERERAHEAWRQQVTVLPSVSESGRRGGGACNIYCRWGRKLRHPQWCRCWCCSVRSIHSRCRSFYVRCFPC